MKHPGWLLLLVLLTQSPPPELFKNLGTAYHERVNAGRDDAVPLRARYWERYLGTAAAARDPEAASIRRILSVLR